LSLAIGTQLGSHEVKALLGKGGMGEVYRAWDSRLKRDVAIKVLPEEFSRDSERVARFRREAEALASLNHPHIAGIYDVGQFQELRFLVLELVEGDTLADRISRGAIPLSEALQIAGQVAEALEAAHEKGIVHRDLKPGNIKIRGDGTVKILDFGLAKFATGETRTDDLANSPTLSIGATQVGIVLGTAAYMAPEQARGKAVDKRADIWAFGAVLYEMLIGRRAFDGEDVSTILAAVIQSEPRWDGVPQKVRRLLESCLEKESKKRLRDIGDVWKLLDDGEIVPPRSRTAGTGWIVAVTMAVVAAVALWSSWRSPSRETARPVVRLDVDLGQEVSLVPLNIPTFSSVIISPDGNQLAYVASVSGGPQKLLTRRLDQTKAVELAGTEGANYPFFSRDGKWLAFFDGKRIAKVAVDGGAVVPLADLDGISGGDWTDDGNLLVGSGIPQTAGILRIAAAGGSPSTLLKLANGEFFHAWPHILPGGRAILITAVGDPPNLENLNIDVVTLADGRRKTLVRGGVTPRYASSGHLLYASRSTVFAIPFDIDKLETHGTAVAVLNDVAYDSVANGAQFDVSRDGTLVYRRSSGSTSGMTRVRWLDATGKQEPLLDNLRQYIGPPRLSPDGRRVAVTIRDGANQDVWVYDAQRGTMTRLTHGGGMFTGPLWSRDGRYIIFGSMGNGSFWTRADGAGQIQPLVTGKTLQFLTSFTPDGKRLAYWQVDGHPQIWSVDVEDSAEGLKPGKPVQFLKAASTDSDPVFSPDGRWIAYWSTESGRPEVYVRAFSPSPGGKEGKWQISNNGGTIAAWSPNRRELLYLSGDQMMSVSYTVSGDSFVAEKPRVWAANVANAVGFDFAPDGKRVVITLPETATAAPLQEHTVVFVQNFFDELRRLAPVDR
jgi:serine/threonine protein kinase/Tol biopolymer transport system component